MADTQATLSVAVKLTDQLSAEMKKVADTTVRESNRAAQGASKIGSGFSNLRADVRGFGQEFAKFGSLFGFGALTGFSLGSIGNYFSEMQADIEKASRALYTFSRAQRSVGADGNGLIDSLKRTADAMRAAYGGSRGDYAGAANIGRSLGLSGKDLTEAIQNASELSSAYGVDLAAAMQAVTEATQGTQDGYKQLGSILGLTIQDAYDAERALQRLRLEGEKARIQYRGGSYAPGGTSSTEAARIAEIDRQLGANGISRPARTARDLEIDATSKLGLAGLDRLTAQRDALSPRTTLYEKNYAAEVEMNQALLELNRSVLELQKTIEARNQGAGSPRLNSLSDSLGQERDRVAELIDRRYRETVSKNTLDYEMSQAERDLQAQKLYDRDPRYGDRGAGRAIADIKAEYSDLNQRAYESVRNLADGLENNLGGAFRSLIDGSKNLSQALRGILDGIVADLTKEAAGQLSKTIVGAIFGAGDRGMTTDGYGFSGSSLMSSSRFMSAYGHAPMRALADGGVLYRPTLAVAGENGPEAFVPLRGGKIPVQTSGGGGATVVNVNLNVSSWDGQDAARSVSKAMPQIVASVQKALMSDRGFRNTVKSL